ncbi:hypothetical protein CC85DRAFT_162948 [Cutaneotrichosporon oleaginosum]|uniref:Uncharacterized protein n=1 Tax=Cutaneotrichosporon oleaginosum TaxID=879819 RepID=A0A0J0XGD0_9TREE|nr:uncharacterized protein CC85DRAFT_162948 [Cutaneotrichosporon oleaginosum]KLT40118.1 hypothetical protein CC85DRAFT_162948 [Cutaneotrichosporon oleaginosum]TXT04756.1 hypothetical protein COLE_07575 [Cutaneotrichosporon oleaginosum]
MLDMSSWRQQHAGSESTRDTRYDPTTYICFRSLCNSARPRALTAHKVGGRHAGCAEVGSIQTPSDHSVIIVSRDRASHRRQGHKATRPPVRK